MQRQIIFFQIVLGNFIRTLNNIKLSVIPLCSPLYLLAILNQMYHNGALSSGGEGYLEDVELATK